jgi:cell division protein FtsQ
MRINWKYCALIVIDLVIVVYLVFAMTSWNKPDETPRQCSKVEINIEDENENGFLKTAEVKSLLEKKNLYPLNKRLDDINTREIENILLKTAFVNTAQCYVTTEGYVKLSLTQRTPIVRVKAESGEDYYIDDNGGVMPNSQYTSDMIIVTGILSKQYACKYISILASTIMADDLWRNQIEQINVLKDKTIEIVPRVGDHVINIGMLPNSRFPDKRKEKVTEFVQKQLRRIELFYKYGLSEAGWNKYSYISVEFANQVICTNRDGKQHQVVKPIAVAQPTPQPETTPANEATQEEKNKVENGKNKVEEQPKKQEPVKKEEKKDNQPKKESKTPTKAKETPKKDSTPKKESTPKKDTTPKKDNSSKKDNSPKKETSSKKENTSKKDSTPKKESATKKDNKPKTADKATKGKKS